MNGQYYKLHKGKNLEHALKSIQIFLAAFAWRFGKPHSLTFFYTLVADADCSFHT